MTDYKRGQVATVEIASSIRFRGIRGVGGWYSDKFGFTLDSRVTDVRPLVVLDPEHPSIRHFISTWVDVLPGGSESTGGAARYLSQQIEAQTKPRVAEPLGLGAVVEGREGNRWVRTNESSGFPWRKVGSVDRVSAWTGITSAYEPVAVLSEGVA